jgi:hypothetical protein
VIRLLIPILCALGLAFAPVVAGAAPAPNSAMLGCTMDGKMPAKPANHMKKDCCTPACQMSSAAALLPERDSAADQIVTQGELHPAIAVKAFESFAPTGLDPPPRA